MSRVDFDSNNSELPTYHGAKLVPVRINGMTVWVQPGVSTKQYRPGFARRLLDALGAITLWFVTAAGVGGAAWLVAKLLGW